MGLGSHTLWFNRHTGICKSNSWTDLDSGAEKKNPKDKEMNCDEWLKKRKVMIQ